MLNHIIEQWHKNKGILEHWFRTNQQREYCKYGQLVKKIFSDITPFHLEGKYDTDKITVINSNGDQGAIIYIVPTYETLTVQDYISTYINYGSCSNCDTLESIHNYEYNSYPDDAQIKKYMALATHIIQRTRMFIDF